MVFRMGIAVILSRIVQSVTVIIRVSDSQGIIGDTMGHIVGAAFHKFIPRILNRRKTYTVPIGHLFVQGFDVLDEKGLGIARSLLNIEHVTLGVVVKVKVHGKGVAARKGPNFKGVTAVFEINCTALSRKARHSR